MKPSLTVKENITIHETFLHRHYLFIG